MKDSNFLHFLKEFPAWIVLFVMLTGLLFVWYISERSFLEHLIDTMAGGLLTLLIGRKATTQTGNTQSGDIVITPDAAGVSNLPEAEITASEDIKEEK